MARKHNKEPAMLRKTPTGQWVVSREWIGWNVISTAEDVVINVNDILDFVETKAPGYVNASANIKATVSRDGKAVVTFTE